MSKTFNVAVLLPTRGRTTALTRSVISLVNRATALDKVQIIFAFDNDDEIGLNHFTSSLEPWLIERKVHYMAMQFEPLGYEHLNQYVNALAEEADADWLFVWNDDAVMDTTGWDKTIAKYTGQFKLLAVHTHRDHPYSIFPIIPSEWVKQTEYVSPHQIIDAWTSQVAYMLDIWERIDVYATHERHDLTGKNNDETFAKRVAHEGNPYAPMDFHNPAFINLRWADAEKLSIYMKSIGLDTTWWENVKTEKQYPWEKVKLNDVNKQMEQFTVRL